jgi:putative ABC transport system permease protein
VTDTRRTKSELLYRRLLRLFPVAFRDRFAADLVDLFRDKHRAAAARGRLALLVFWILIVADVVISAAAERFRPGRSSPTKSKGSLMEGLLQDVKYATRMIARRPALSLVIILTLGLGIGANIAIFSLVNTVLLRRLPYPGIDRLVAIWERQIENSEAIRPVRPANFFEWKGRATSFEDIAWSRDGTFSLTGEGQPESITGYRFSANMLDVLGVQPALGRGFRAEEDRPGAPHVVLLSDKLWRRRYAADPSILGRTLTLNGQSYTVIGVMAPDFRHPQRSELWIPIALTEQQTANRTATILRLVGRLKPGVPRERAEAEVAALYRELAERYPDVNKGLTASLGVFGGTGDAKPLLLVLFAGVGFVLLIACANVANLLLAEASSRRRELAVRSALGASRFRVVRQLLTESLLLAIAGGGLGALVTWWTRDGLVALFPSNIANLNLPLVEQIDLGPRVFLFAAAVSLAAGLLFGLLPAWHVARANLQRALKDGGRSASGSRRTHAALVISEVALSIVLLAGALLMVQSFVRVQRMNFGFDVDGILTGRVILPAYRYPDIARVEAFTRALIPRLRTIPGVDAVGITNYLPLSGWSGGINFSIEGQAPLTRAEQPGAGYQVANDEYFKAMGMVLASGRGFTELDREGAPRVVVINETLAKRYWPGRNPIGTRVLIDGSSGQTPYEIVGIVGDVRAFGLEEPAEGEMYLSYWQAPDPLLGIVLRTSGDPAALAGQLRDAVWTVDREQPVTYVLTMSELAAESLTFRRAGMMLAGSFALVALVLAAIGIYGVLSYSVTRRTREIGVRVALGATRGEVGRLVVREGMVMTVAGIAIGLAAAAALTRFLRSVLYEVTPGDPFTYAAVGGILLAVALIACWLPARRATSVDPLVALRVD